LTIWTPRHDYSVVSYREGNYIAAAKAAELVLFIDECMGSVENIIEYYFLARDYERVLIAHKVYKRSTARAIKTLSIMRKQNLTMRLS
jgi:hypothetical protein